jgi:hypothetical protein
VPGLRRPGQPVLHACRCLAQIANFAAVEQAPYKRRARKQQGAALGGLPVRLWGGQLVERLIEASDSTRGPRASSHDRESIRAAGHNTH